MQHTTYACALHVVLRVASCNTAHGLGDTVHGIVKEILDNLDRVWYNINMRLSEN